MRLRTIVALVAVVAAAAGSFGCVEKKATRTLDKQTVGSREVVYTPKYRFPIVLDELMNFDLAIVDKHWDEFSACMVKSLGVRPDIQRAKRFSIVVTKRGWECRYHSSGCKAEIDFSTEKIYLTRLNLKMDKHEYAHLYGLLDSNDRLTAKGRNAGGCFPMKAKK